MTASDYGEPQKRANYGDQPTINRAMRVQNVRSSALDDSHQGKQGRYVEGPIHGQGNAR